LSHVYVYGYGVKDTELELLSFMDEMCTLGGAIDNLYDVGRNFHSRNMFLFRVPSQEALRVGKRVYGMREQSLPAVQTYREAAWLCAVQNACWVPGKILPALAALVESGRS
jgi:hypothetical protein